MEVRTKSFIVTGASGGIGAGTAVALGAAGARVTLVARRRVHLDAVAETIRTDGGSAHVVEADIASPTAATTIVGEAVDAFGGLDGVINNAGYLGARVPIVDYPEDEMARSLEVNVMGTFRMIRAALPALQKAPAAAIVNISTYLGRHGLPDCAGYIAGKFGVEGLTQAAASEVEASHIAVVSLAPGMVATPMLRAYLGEDDVSEHRNPVDVGAAIVRLLSELTPAHNGAILDIDPWMVEEAP